jgi:hypothetical protein
LIIIFLQLPHSLLILQLLTPFFHIRLNTLIQLQHGPNIIPHQHQRIHLHFRQPLNILHIQALLRNILLNNIEIQSDLVLVLAGDQHFNLKQKEGDGKGKLHQAGKQYDEMEAVVKESQDLVDEGEEFVEFGIQKAGE